VLSPVTLCLRVDKVMKEFDSLAKAAEHVHTASIFSSLDNPGRMAMAKESYLHAIEYLKMAKRQYANDPSRMELVQT
jgi:hypothetical protein